MFDKSEIQQLFLKATDSHLMVQGGPGAGKTTVAIIKAKIIVNEEIASSQKVLFLSFARPTIARVIEAISENSDISKEEKKQIEVSTYHAFFWSIIKTHGYLIGLSRKLSILLPSDEAIKLSSIRYSYPKTLSDSQTIERDHKIFEERKRLAYSEGQVCFDLFASLASKILEGSNEIRQLVSSAFPYIILDEFQDTNSDQWDIINTLGRGSSLICLADPFQRIYDFIGADPQRIQHFKDSFNPKCFDFKSLNFRSDGTEILDFANDLMDANFQKDSYNGIDFITFNPNKNQAYTSLKSTVLSRRKKLSKNNDNWSIAVLVPTKKMMRAVSFYLREKQNNLPSVDHQAVIEMEGVILSSEIISFLLQPYSGNKIHEIEKFINLVINFYFGRKGDKPTKGDIEQGNNIQKRFKDVYQNILEEKEIPKNNIISSMLLGFSQCRSLSFEGDPEEDWKSIHQVLKKSGCSRLKEVYEESKNLRLLGRGTLFRDKLTENWREYGSYQDALSIAKETFIQDHFITSMKPESGVIVMNMHKAKGKQFDEVILFEGWPLSVRKKVVSNQDRFVRNNEEENMKQAVFNFRVSVTRAKTKVTILTPKNDPCLLLCR